MSGMSFSSIAPSPLSSVRLATIGAISTWLCAGSTVASPVQLHSSTASKGPVGGRHSQASPIARGKQRIAVVSQYSPAGQSRVDVQGSPGVTQDPR